MSTRVALITGVSSGIGNSIARKLVAHGYRVFGTARSPDTAMPAKVERVLLDVLEGASVEAGVREVLAKAGRIDLLVNNAGGGMIGAVEETSIAQAQKLFDLNFFGAVRMTQAVLPTMRAQRSGRIVFISSVVGFLPAPYMGFYAASKHALEGLAESLDHETRTLGIRATLVEPGFMRTNIRENGMSAGNSVDVYAFARLRAGEQIAARVSAGDDPSIVADVVFEAATAAKPRLRYPVGKGAGLLSRLRRFLPESMFDSGLRKEFGLDGGPRAPVA
jgi:NAD(P)-dependent dehydrogenase (short-subunit alcohol dehydrogenase family)